MFIDVNSGSLIYVTGPASEKGPHGHIKFDRNFQLCRLITSDHLKELP